MTKENEIDRIMVDQSVVVARILEATARLGEIQTVVSRALVDLHIPQDKDDVLVQRDEGDHGDEPDRTGRIRGEPEGRAQGAGTGRVRQALIARYCVHSDAGGSPRRHRFIQTREHVKEQGSLNHPMLGR